MKTNKAIAKRFKVTRNGKIEKKIAGHCHFNAHETGKVGRQKRGKMVTSQTLRKVISVALPNI